MLTVSMPAGVPRAAGESGHLYFGETGHFYLGTTFEVREVGVTSNPVGTGVLGHPYAGLPAPRARSTPTSSGASSAPRWCRGRSSWSAATRRSARRRECFASRERTTSSRTETSYTSASTSEKLALPCRTGSHRGGPGRLPDQRTRPRLRSSEPEISRGASVTRGSQVAGPPASSQTLGPAQSERPAFSA